MRKLYITAVFVCLSVFSFSQVSVTATSGTTGPTSYTTVNAAFTAINAGTHQGDVVITVTANTTEPATPVPLLSSGTGSSSFTSVLIKPQGNVVINSAASPTANRGVIELAGADNVTIDGDDPGTSGLQNLTIQAVTAAPAGTACIRLSSNSTTGADGADNNTVKNCIIIGSRSSATSTTTNYGIQFSNGTGASSSGTGAYSSLNTLIQNNKITRCYYGVWAVGSSSNYLNTGTRIIGNTIGSSTAADAVGTRGISVSYTATAAGPGSVLIQGNDVRTGFTSGTGSFSSIEIGASNAGALIDGNNIHDCINTTGSVWGMYAIGIISSTNNNDIEIRNNFIRDISGYATGTLGSIYGGVGVFVDAAITGLKINHNTFAQFISTAIGTCIKVNNSSATIAECQNNIFVNTVASTAASVIYTAATANISGAVMNYNDYYVSASARTGYYNGTAISTLDAWKTATSKDANSLNINPVFVSATDLHLSTTVVSALESAGTPTSITTDIDGNVRPGPAGSVNGGGTAPDIGADEFDGIPLPPFDLIPYALVTPATIGCDGTAPVTVRVKSIGLSTIDFATHNVSITAQMTGAGTGTATGTITSGTLDPYGVLDVNLTNVNTPVPGVYNFKIVITMTGDGVTSNDTLYATSTVENTVTLPQSVGFTGYTGADLTTLFPNWKEGVGQFVPSGTTSAWLNLSTWAGGNVTAKVNLFTNTRREWIVGPKFMATANSRLKVDVAITDYNSTAVDASGGITGTDDSVIVKISTDCGATYQNLYVFDAASSGSISNTLTTQIIDLSAYAGQRVMIAFFATDGAIDNTNDYDFHIDNVLIENAVPNDAGAISLEEPVAADQCYTATQLVTVKIKNFGTAVLNLATTPITVTAQVTGAVTTTLTGIANSGVLNPDETINVDMSTTLDMSAGGTYNFKLFTTLTGDAIAGNDTVTATRVASVSLPQSVDFTGFTGANLTTVFPNWREAAGATPTGTTSGWANTTLGTGNTTARVNLYTNTKNEWIIGPRVLVTPASRLKFDIAITDFLSTAADATGMQGTDDKLTVKISTDCGATYQDLFVFNAANTTTITNSLVPQTIDLSPYAGDVVIIAFLASDGPSDDASDYDVHIDNILIENGPAIDLGAVGLSAPAIGCYGSAEQVRVVIKNFGVAPIDFSTLPVTVTTQVTGATTAVLTGTLNTGTLAAYDTIGVYMSAPLNMSVAGTYNFKAFSTITGDASVLNDTISGITRTTIASVALPQSVNFTGFTGADLTTVFPNWREASGVPAAGTTSAWLNTTLGTGNTTAKINLYTNTRKEWIIGPKFVAAANSRLKFDVAITDFAATTADPTGMQGTDDSVIVKISTDCGATFQNLYVFDAASTTGISNTLTSQNIDLSVYAGQQCIIAFFASDGPVDNTSDYDFHIDNIIIENAVPSDAGAVAILNPTTAEQCYTSTETVTVRIKNFGTAFLDFSVTPLTVTTQVTGATTATLTAVLNAGGLNPDETMDVDMSTTLNMTVPGTFNLKAFTTLTGDATTGNDTVTASRVSFLVLPISADFTGFTGANLSTVVSNWREGAGATAPVGTTSAWVSQSAWTGNTTAKVNLFTDNRNEWIVGPKFMATSASQIKFDVAITDYNSVDADPAGMQGTDDKVTVKVSTDCGATYQDLYVFNAANTTAISNTLTPQMISLGAYAGQMIMIAFHAQDGPVNDAPDYDFHIDNIVIEEGTLPVTLVNFTGETSGTANILHWSTKTESNNKGFELQRSADGKNFSALAFTATKAENGNSASALSYLYTDEKPAAGNNYYRLKQVDKDGKFSYSNVVLLGRKVTSITLSSVYPNPTKEMLNVKITAPSSEKITLVVTDLSGKVIMQKAIQVVMGDNQQQMNVHSLSAGTYIIKAVCANGCETAVHRFIKQ